MDRIIFTASMVKPLREHLQMTQESFAYVVDCGSRSISHYETDHNRKVNARIRNNMIRLMTKNGITTEDLGGTE